MEVERIAGIEQVLLRAGPPHDANAPSRAIELLKLAITYLEENTNHETDIIDHIDIDLSWNDVTIYLWPQFITPP